MSFLKLGLIMGLSLIAMVAVACGDDDDDNGGATSLGAELKEYSITLDKSTVPAGDVDVSAENTGDLDHELIVARTDLAADALPMGENRVDETRLENQGGEILGEIEEFSPGNTESQTFKLGTGKYVLFCNIAGHYELGMHTTLTVQ